MLINMRLNLSLLCVCVLTAFPFVVAAQNVEKSPQNDTTTQHQPVPLTPHRPKKDSTRKDSTKPLAPVQATPSADPYISPYAKPYARTRRRVQGYRIQVYTGGNTRQAKQAAFRMKERVQKIFPELSVYIHFQAPRWICRVGDFISREEAKPYLKELRKQRISTEANIVSSPVSRSF